MKKEKVEKIEKEAEKQEIVEKVKGTKKPTSKKKTHYFREVQAELKKVTWPTAKIVVKYTIATIILCVIFVIFFILINLLSSAVKGMFI